MASSQNSLRDSWSEVQTNICWITTTVARDAWARNSRQKDCVCSEAGREGQQTQPPDEGQHTQPPPYEGSADAVAAGRVVRRQGRAGSQRVGILSWHELGCAPCESRRRTRHEWAPGCLGRARARTRTASGWAAGVAPCHPARTELDKHSSHVVRRFCRRLKVVEPLLVRIRLALMC